LEELWLKGNICISIDFEKHQSLATIRHEVFKACGSAYTLHELEKKLDARDKENAKSIQETKKIGEAIYELLLQNRRARMW
jgi:hypothetical protein